MSSTIDGASPIRTASPKTPKQWHVKRVAARTQEVKLLAKTLAQESSLQVDMAARLAKGIAESANHFHLLSRGLVPVEVDAEGLRSALTDLASQVAEQYGVRCDFQCDGVVELSDNFKATHLYRIAQEAVNNAIKHGRANRIQISLTGVDKSITLQVSDDGIGHQRPAGPGMGLRTWTIAPV